MEKVINVGLVGFGMSARVFHAPFIATLPGFCLYGVVERKSNHAEQHYPQIRTFRSLEEMLNDEKVELVVITTPNETHFPFAMQSLMANRHVVLEKPFTNTCEEGLRLIETAKAQNRLLSVYQNRRYVSDFRTIVPLLQQQLLGKVHEYECHFDRYRPKAKPNAWREKNEAGSGITYDLGSHLIDQALCLFGLPKQITADIKKQRPHAQTDDYFDIRLQYDFAKIILRSGMLVREMGPRYQIHGTLGSFIKYGDDPQEAMLKEGVMPNIENWGKEDPAMAGLLHTEINGKTEKKFLPSEAGNFGDYYRNLHASITLEKPPQERAAHGYNTIRLIELAFKSSQLQQTLAVDGLLDEPYPFNLPE